MVKCPQCGEEPDAKLFFGIFSQMEEPVTIIINGQIVYQTYERIIFCGTDCFSKWVTSLEEKMILSVKT